MANIKTMTHQQFLDKLWEKNEHYRNGDFWVLGEYAGVRAKIRIETKYGECSVFTGSLLSGNCPTIETACDKNKYFRNKLIEKNKYYRENTFSIESDYITATKKILTSTKYGNCEIQPCALLMGREPTIESAIDKTQFFCNRLKELNPSYSKNLFWVKGEYLTTDSKILLGTPFGDCIGKPATLLRGACPDISNAIDKTSFFKKNLLSKNKAYTSGEFEVTGEYRSTKIKIEVENKYGKCHILPSDLLKGGSPTIKSAVDKEAFYRNMLTESNKFFREGQFWLESEYENSSKKLTVRDNLGILEVRPFKLTQNWRPNIESAVDKSQYFKAKCVELFGEDGNDDLSLVDYKNVKTKITVVDPIYGPYKITPSNYLGGSRSLDSAKEKMGWTDYSWEQCGLSSFHFKSFKVYFIKCFDKKTGELFYKIGKTFGPIYRRFRRDKELPYDYEIVALIEGTSGVEISKLERKYIQLHLDYKYTPLKKFGGHTECFSKLVFI